MSIDDIDNYYAGWKQQQKDKELQPSSTLSEEEAVQMGLLKPEQQPEQIQQPEQTQGEEQQPQGDGLIDYLNSDKEYEKLSLGESWKDMFKAVGTEASHVFVPKQYEKHYEAKTHFAENTKYLYRYGVGTLALMLGGEVAAGIKGLGIAGKAISGAGKVLTYKPFNAVGVGLKAARAGKSAKAAMMGANALNGMVEGTIAGAIADYNLYRPEENEGVLFDAFGDTNNKFVSLLQSNPDAPEYQERLKNVVNGLFLALPLGAGIEVGLKPLCAKGIRGIHKAVNGKTQKAVKEGIQEFQTAAEAMDNKAKTLDMWEKVKSLQEEAYETGEELDRLIIDNFPSDLQAEARGMGKLAEAGEDIFPYADGTWSIRVTNSWEDAHKVSFDEYQRQLSETDPLGNLGITHQDQAVRSTWVNRGWLGENEELTQANANKIVKNYKDKLQIDNDIKVEFVDGLTIKGEAVDGNTTATTFLGKNKKPTKAAQTKIDKKQQEIRRLQDKITQLEGGNEPVNDELDLLKEDLRIKLNELKDLEQIPAQDKISNITIKIDKNAQNPYATLRAEIEHARDMAKGEVPNQTEKHFSRYDGLNESEVAPQYTYKKSKGRAEAVELEKYQPISKEELDNYEIHSARNDDFGENPDIVEPDYEPYTIHNITDSEGRNLAHLRIKHGNFIDWRANHGIESGAARKLIAKLLYEGKYPTLVWDATSEGSVKSYERFCREFPDLVDRIQYTDKYTKTVDINPSSPYNPEKGVSNGKGSNQLSEQQPILEEGRRNKPNDSGQEGLTSPEGQESVRDRGESSGNSTTNAGRENPVDNAWGKQLTIDFNPRVNTAQSTDDIVNGLASGELKVNTLEDLEATLTKMEELDPDISGKKFIDVAEDADSWFNRNINDGTVEDAVAYAKSLSTEDSKVVDKIVRKQIAAAKLLQLLQGKLEQTKLGQLDDILTSLRNVSKYVEEYNHSIASSMGRGLRYQALNKDALEQFSFAGLSQAEKGALMDIAEVVNGIYKQTLNFTRTNPLQVKNMFWENLEKLSPEFYNTAMQDQALLKRLNNILDECVKEKNPADFLKKVAGAFAEEDMEKLSWLVKLCDTTKGISDTVNKWSKNTSAYMINNVLGLKSLMNNIIGAGRTVTFPANKVLGGLLTGDTYVTREGLRTYQNMLVNFGEALRMAKQAFKNGDGILTNTKSFTDDILQKGFNEWSFSFRDLEQTGITLQNIHSFFPRLMMASDEFLSQLNYRSIMRAKAQELVDNEGLMRNFSPSELAQRVDSKFQEIAFDDNGYPLDIAAFTEAKDILFQVPLNRKLFNPATGESEDVSRYIGQTALTKLGTQVQSLTERVPFLKLIYPFVKTPTNIAQAALETNPLYMALSPDFKARFFSSDPMTKAKARGHLALCTMLHTAGLFMAAQGMLTGSEPFDRKEKAALLKTGWRPYSFYVNGKYYSYKNYVPYDSILATCADIAAIGGRVLNPDIQMSIEDIAARSMASVMNNYIDQVGFRTNSEKMLDIINPSIDSRRREQLIAALGAGYIPMGSAIRDVQSLRHSEVTTGQGLTERLFKNIAPDIVKADYVRDVFGRRTDIHNYLISQTTDADFDTPEYREMQRLAELGWSPKKLKGIVEETKVPFGDYKSKKTGRSAQDALGEELTKVTINDLTLREAVAELAQSQEYKDLPTGISQNPEEDWSNSPYDTQIKSMALLFKEYYDEAKNRIINDRAGEFVNSKGESMELTSERVRGDMENKLINLYRR